MQRKSDPHRALIAALGAAVLLSASACALRIGGDTIGEILAREKTRLPASHEVFPSSREKLLLKKVLTAFDLPEDHAELSVFDRPEQSAAAGAVRHLYVSSGLLRDFRRGILPETQFAAVLAHEVAHMVLEHPMQAASSLRLGIEYESDISALVDRAVAMNIARRAKPDATLLDSVAYSAQVNAMLRRPGESQPSIWNSPQELASVLVFPLYSYPLTKELEADAMSGKVLAALGYPSGALAPFLARQLEYLPGQDNRELKRALRERMVELNRT